MVEQEPQTAASDTEWSGAAKARVTAREFSAAVDSVERRRSSDAARLADTVEIGQTIQELRIDASPEEILREVEAQRAIETAAAKECVEPEVTEDPTPCFVETRVPPPAQSINASQTLLVAAPAANGYVAASIGIVLLFFVFIVIGCLSTSSNTTISAVGFPPYPHITYNNLPPGSVSVTGPTPVVVGAPLPWSPPPQMSGSGETIVLAQVKENQTVYATSEVVTELALGGGKANGINSSASARTEPGGETWPITLRGATFYLEGYTLQKTVVPLGPSPPKLGAHNRSIVNFTEPNNSEYAINTSDLR